MNQNSQNFSPGAFPAIVIGGPPHSGKSVLVYSLTHALRRRRVDHFVLRACPDGEGDWSNEANQNLVKVIRDKGAYSRTFVDRVVRDLQRRHVPLLVDVGGKPRPWQEVIFEQCTHAILLAARRNDDPEAHERALDTWQAMMGRYDIPVIARLSSVLYGPAHLEATMPQIRGTLSGLERGRRATGPVFEELVDQLQQRLAIPEQQLAQYHLSLAPAELTLHLPRLARTLGAAEGRWLPQHLPSLLEDYLPAGKPLALYGRGPNWLYAALARLALPADVWLFDPRLGWVQPPRLPVGTARPGAQAGWRAVVESGEQMDVLKMYTGSHYLDVEQAQRLPLPPLSSDRGLVIDGRVPFWLLLSVVRQAGAARPWLAVYQPPLNAAVVVSSNGAERAIGELIHL